MVPEPLPEPAVTVNHEALLEAVHEQLAVVVTPIEPVPAVAAMDVTVVDKVNVQPAAACVTVTV
jgi:hypothetical protein